jgi:hypothetical protein
VVTAAATVNSKQKATAVAQPINLVAYLTLVPFKIVINNQQTVLGQKPGLKTKN